MLGMLKRHEVEILLKAGHSKAEAARLAGVSLRSVNRIAKEARSFLDFKSGLERVASRDHDADLRLSRTRRDSHGDKKVAGEKVGEQMSERWRATQLAGRNPSIRLTPLPPGN